ncbi:V-type proton ATPase subunit E [Smittium culicis]|uniref:V-type proton ATPase subunit E n=1 Tax=Smittium culicis TaxID=133412 RepID=A0A1R1YFH4_9FUNG|nr:V-type proton ATPase subunit E [Smittium culicis]
MALNRPLNDDEVYNEMNKMISFIKQEAFEKAREIKAKADEEFNIEKAKILRQESINIEKQYERKLKQAEFDKRITSSNLSNKCKLQILQKQQQVLDDLFSQSFNEIQNVKSNKEKYKYLMMNLLVQSFCKISEENVSVRVVKEDVSLLKQIIEKSCSEYTKLFNKPISATVSENDCLSSDYGGGVIVSALGDRISVDNTLRTRLDISSRDLLPQIRVILFGHSPNRKFFD